MAKENEYFIKYVGVSKDDIEKADFYIDPLNQYNAIMDEKSQLFSFYTLDSSKYTSPDTLFSKKFGRGDVIGYKDGLIVSYYLPTKDITNLHGFIHVYLIENINALVKKILEHVKYLDKYNIMKKTVSSVNENISAGSPSISLPIIKSK